MNPDQLPASAHGSQWKFDLQRRSHTGKWKTVKKRVQTKGASHVRTLKVKPGVYRVVVRPAFGYPTATSATIAVAK